VRRGSLIRSDAPISLGEQGRAALRASGIRTALDLREPAERELDPADLDGLGIELRQVPIIGDVVDINTAASLGDIYRELLERRGPSLAAAVRVLSEPGALPALVFCSAGKDRTGLVVALALGAVGVSIEGIVADYTLTEHAMNGPFRDVIERRAVAAGVTEQELAVKMGAPPELMREVLAWLADRAGGPAGYLRQHGLTEEELLRLERAIVVPPAASAA
jgi:protein-tyrosine phosphatase